MLNKSIKFLIHNKIVALILLVGLSGWGIYNAPFNWQIPGITRSKVAVDAIPNLGENQQIVFTKWDGRSPQDIQDQITYPLTTALLGVPGVKTVRSSSMFGFSSIYVIFDDDVDFYWSRSRILEKLNSLPSNLLPADVNPTLGPDATGLGQVFWYTLEGRDKDGNVTGGWDPQEVRSIQDYYVKYGLAGASGVSEVASVGGYVKEYQIDVDPEMMRQYDLTLNKVVEAIKNSNTDVGAQTLEINKAEYLVRGLGYVKSIDDIEKAVISSEDYTALRVKDVAKVHLGPAARRGILDKEGAQVVGGVVTARYGANPMEVIKNVKNKINKISPGLPSKTLKDGRESKLTIVPFYDRSQLIQETLGTLNEALTMEILITILVIIVMVYNLRASLLISGLLPVAVLMVFIAMKIFDVTANIVALSGIAIAIGTMVDMGIILAENIIRHLDDDTTNTDTDALVYRATSEVSGAILTAVLTTIISFIPVFTMTGASGKLFHPLAFTKTMALVAALIVALFLIPPFAAFVFHKRKSQTKAAKLIINSLFLIIGIGALIYGYFLGVILIAFAISGGLKTLHRLTLKQTNFFNIVISAFAIVYFLAEYWRPLGVQNSVFINLILVGVLVFGLLGLFALFRYYYKTLLHWALNHKFLFLMIPALLIAIGGYIMAHTGREFMPALDEGSFLLMPTSLPHSGIEENKEVLQKLDMATANIPEIETVVGKAGRTESPLDPAPLSMYENIIQYKPEYMLNDQGKRQRYKTNDQGYFVLKDSTLVENSNTPADSDQKPEGNLVDRTDISSKDLIPDDNGEFYRNWRPEIKSRDDIWDAISDNTRLPGITSAPKLQPIQTRQIMLQSGMRAPMGIKVKGKDLYENESFGLKLERILKQVKGLKKQSVFADRVIGKPYLLIDIDRDKLARYGLSIQDVQNTIKVAIGGMPISQTVEGRERYNIRVRYPREIRDSPEDIKDIYISLKNGHSIRISDVADIRYRKGPQVIKSEDTFLTSYVLFDKKDNIAEVDAVENAKEVIHKKIDEGELKVPEGISFDFAGDYENQVKANKTLMIVVPLALLIIFLILYFQFRSVSISLMIFSGIAMAFAGGFIMIWLYGQDWFFNFSLFGENLRDLFQMHTVNLSVAVWVGFIALFGIATDDGVVMGTYLVQTFDKNKPKDKQKIRQSVIEAGQKRIRPCLMTVATTILALLPILTSTGRGSDIMIPMAIPSFGGMLVALITLFVVPVLFCIKEELSLKRSLRELSNQQKDQ